ncbi:MAG: hypothetical protein AB1Z22_07200, partial [Synechococcaceae cyanobacterium]
MVNPAPVRSSPLVLPQPWKMALVAGFCFGLGYGVVQRLMRLELPRGVQLVASFRMREFPGTTLDSLRLKLGEEPRSIRGDLGALEQEEQQRKAEAERRRLEQELEAERQRERLEAPLSRELEPTPAPLPLPAPAS